MNYIERLKEARNAVEGMAVLAAGIDEITAQLDIIAGHYLKVDDGWGTWDTDLLTTPSVRKGYHAVLDASVRSDEWVPDVPGIERLREAIAETTDPEDLQALHAKLKLLTEPSIIPYAVPEGNRYTESDGTVTLPPADPARKQARWDWATAVGLGTMMDPPMDVHEAAEGYSKGGPMWLYLPQRKTIMGMPEQWRQMMVEDVERDSIAASQELARDILKDASASLNSADISIEAMARQMKDA